MNRGITSVLRGLASRSRIGGQVVVANNVRAFTITPSNKKKKKKKGDLSEEKVKRPYQRWTFGEYMQKKDPDADYGSAECEGLEMTCSMLLERTPRLSRNVPSWKIEWDVLQDEIRYNTMKIAPDEWMESKKTVEDEATKMYKPNHRVTHADLGDDRRSLWRSLDCSTYLVLQAKNGEWSLPTAAWAKNETLRETVERGVPQLVGTDMDTYLLGNAPIGHLENDNKRNFLFRNLWQYGNVELGHNENVTNFAWINSTEFKDYLSPETIGLLKIVLFEEFLDPSDEKDVSLPAGYPPRK